MTSDASADYVSLVSIVHVVSLVLLLTLAGCSERVVEVALSDRVVTAAQDMRWEKQSDRKVTVPLRFRAPVLVLALPAGRYTSDKLDSLLPIPDARGHVNQWSRSQPLTPDRPAIYILPTRGGEVTFYQSYDHVFIPVPIALWKADDGPLEVVLHRENDRVDIIALR